jgi:SAM-dependent methyltransferase
VAPRACLERTAYEAWRSTRLGAAVESVESSLVFRLAPDLDGLTVLDLGCGDGTCAIGAARRGAQAIGIDVDSGVLDVARARAAAAGVEVRWLAADAHSLPLEDACCDVVIAVTLLCVVQDPVVVVREVCRVLKPGGRLILGELDRWSTWSLWRRLRTQLGLADWSRVRFWSAGELRRLVQAAGLRFERVRGAVWFPPVETWALPLSRYDARLGALTWRGAAFLAVSAQRGGGTTRSAAVPTRTPR